MSKQWHIVQKRSETTLKVATKQHRRNRHEENGNITLPETSPTKLDTAHGEQKQFLQVIFSRLSQVDPELFWKCESYR